DEPEEAVEYKGIDQQDHRQIAGERTLGELGEIAHHGAARATLDASTGTADDCTCQRPRARAANDRQPPISQMETSVRERIAAYQLGSIGDQTMTGSETMMMPAAMSKRVAVSSGSGRSPPR